LGEPFRHQLRVRYNECDPQGVVFNANFLTYFDIAITELYREAFGSWEKAMAEHGLDAVVAEARVRYLAPLRFDEEFELVARFARIGETSTTTAISVERAGEPVAEGEVRHVFVDPDSRGKIAIPPGLRAALASYAGA
jgi:acyl-CoA thioester hydrolase